MHANQQIHTRLAIQDQRRPTSARPFKTIANHAATLDGGGGADTGRTSIYTRPLYVLRISSTRQCSASAARSHSPTPRISQPTQTLRTTPVFPPEESPSSSSLSRKALATQVPK
eukprot:8733744-Pyramimonas_sp.AAC.1